MDVDLLSKIAREVAEAVDNDIAKAFVLEAGRTLRKKGIDIWYTTKKIREEVEEDDSKCIYRDTYEIHFDSVDTSIHDKQIRDEILDNVQVEVSEKIEKQIGEEVLEEIFKDVDDVDMDSNYIYLKFDKEKYSVPNGITRKAELKDWFLSR